MRMIMFSYISGKLLEGVKHIEAVEIYDASCQCVIVSDDMSRSINLNARFERDYCKKVTVELFSQSSANI